jgi:hypothetical protein
MGKNDRAIPLDDKLLLSMVEQKGEMVESGRAISKQMEEMQKQHAKLGDDMTALMAEVNKKKVAIFKRVEKLAKKQLGEFDIPVTTDIQDGKLVLVVTDALAEFKDSFNTFDKFKEPVPRKSK